MKVYTIHRSFPSVLRSIDVLRRHQFASVHRPCDDKFIAWPATSSNERGSYKMCGIPMAQFAAPRELLLGLSPLEPSDETLYSPSQELVKSPDASSARSSESASRETNALLIIKCALRSYKENNMKQDARKNWHRRKRQKRRLAMRKYIAEKKSKGLVVDQGKP